SIPEGGLETAAKRDETERREPEPRDQRPADAERAKGLGEGENERQMHQRRHAEHHPGKGGPTATRTPARGRRARGSLARLDCAHGKRGAPSERRFIRALLLSPRRRRAR